MVVGLAMMGLVSEALGNDPRLFIGLVLISLFVFVPLGEWLDDRETAQ
ncbi:MAG: hypothetical protein ABEI86_11055 [Halobacteriaceae archaeon]